MPPQREGFPVISRSPGETRSVAARFAAQLMPGDVVALYGDLGAGKTEFVRGACDALGIDAQAVSSPTFTLVNEYDSGRLPVYHLDAYRVKSADEFFEFGFQEYFEGSGVCFIEWPERIEDLLDDHAIRLRFEHRGPHERSISHE